MILKIIKWFERNSKVSISVTILISITIFYVSSLSFPPSIEINSIKPLIYHFGIFFLLSFFLMISSVKGKYKKYLLFTIPLSFLYAVLDELHQSFVPFRDASMGDILTDIFGISFALILYIISLVYRNNFSTKNFNHSI